MTEAVYPVDAIIVHYLWRSSCGIRFAQPKYELIRRISEEVNHVSFVDNSKDSHRMEKQYSPTFRLLYQAHSLPNRALRREKKSDYQKRYSTLNGATIDALQKLNYDWMQETHVLGTAYRKTIHAEMTDHFRYILERLAELSQDVSV